MASLFSKADNLVLNRRAVTWPGAVDLTAIHRRFVQVIADNLVGLLIGVSHITRDLFLLNALGHVRKGQGLVITWLQGQLAIINGTTIQTGRGSRLQTTQLKLHPLKGFGQFDRGRLASAAAAHLGRANVNQTTQERTRGDDHRLGLKSPTAGTYHGFRHALIIEQNIFHHRLFDGEVLGCLQLLTHRFTVNESVGLGTGATHGRALGSIQHTELDTGLIGHPTHDTV